jgi:molybdenum cofactor sulfurtransferase
MCNPGGAAALLGIQDSMKDVEEGGMMREGMTLRQFEEDVDRERRRMRDRGGEGGLMGEMDRLEEGGGGGRTELGVVRISLGLGTDWSDVWRVVKWARRVGDARERKTMWGRWMRMEQRLPEAEEEEHDGHEWQEVEGGAVRRRDFVGCTPCAGKGIDKGALACVKRVSLAEGGGEGAEGWDTIGRAL